MQLRIRTCVVALVTVSLILCSGVLLAQDPQPQKERAPEKQAAPEQGTSWSGKLLDADCRASKPTDPCDATASTANFGIVTSDNAFYKLDDKGSNVASSRWLLASHRLTILLSLPLATTLPPGEKAMAWT